MKENIKKNNGKIVRGAASLGVGAFIAKLLGALYRVPLTNLIGGFGLGLYQTVFPVYTLLLDFSGAGVPSALSKLISASEKDGVSNAYAYLKVSLRLMLIFGLIGSVAMLLLARPVSFLQGNSDAFLAYLFLAPSVFLVSLISCFRGYFQGLMRMTPTAVSQIIEQVVKLLLGLLFAYLMLPNIKKAVAGATFAITLSELTSLIIIYLTYKKSVRSGEKNFVFDNALFYPLTKKIIKTTVPITLVGIMIPLSHVIDSFLVVNILSVYRSDATSLYGLLSGVVCTVINLPVSVCYGISSVAIPAVSGAEGEKEKNRSAAKTLLLTALIALPCSIFLSIFAPFTINLLFGSLSTVEKTTAIKLLTLTSINVLLLSLVQTSNAALIGKGRLYAPLFSLSIGVLVKTALSVALMNIPELNIYGSAVALIACYFLTCLINLFMIFSFKVKNESKRTFNRQYASP